MDTLRRWLPAGVVMVIIYLFSAQPSSQLPQFGFWDLAVKKASHMIGYAALGWAYAYALEATSGRRLRLAFILAVLYAMTDEIHQTFVPGRNGTGVDVGVDAVGAGLALWRWSQRGSEG